MWTLVSVHLSNLTNSIFSTKSQSSEVSLGWASFKCYCYCLATLLLWGTLVNKDWSVVGYWKLRSLDWVDFTIITFFSFLCILLNDGVWLTNMIFLSAVVSISYHGYITLFSLFLHFFLKVLWLVPVSCFLVPLTVIICTFLKPFLNSFEMKLIVFCLGKIEFFQLTQLFLIFMFRLVLLL